MNAAGRRPDQATRQLDRYAEDFGALFTEYVDIKSRYHEALMAGRRAGEIQHSLQTLLESLDDVGGIIVTDSEGVICECTPAAAGLLGVTEAGMIGKPLALLVDQQDRDLIGDIVLALGKTVSVPLQLPVAVHITASSAQQFSLRALRVPDPVQGYRLHWLLRRESRHEGCSDQRAELFSQIYARSSNAIMVTDTSGTVLSVNPAFTEITGYAESEIEGKTLEFLASERHDQAFYASIWRGLIEQGEWQGEIWNRRKNGETYLQWMSILSVQGDQGEAVQYVAMFYDAGHYRSAQNRIYELANHDALTGLPNRALCLDRLKQGVAQARRSKDSIGLLFLDLDRFKEVNDTLGHAVGDQLLIDFSWRLVHAIRDGDTAGRLGGDEFVVIAPHLVREEDIRIVADKIIQSVAEPFLIDGRELYVGVSVGVAVFPTHGETADLLLKHADAAMYAAKGAGGNACRLFDDALGRRRAARLDMEAGLRRALAQGQFRLVYQPQVTARTGRIVGVEALLRWDWPEHGEIPPDQFIPLAEDTGLIVAIGEWVLRAACAQAMAWQREGLGRVRMAVNVTARQLNAPSFAQTVEKILTETGLPASDLEIEITESQLMEQLHTGLDNLARLRSVGAAVAVDDFGTGYSSLGRIHSLPIDRIKVDRSFVVDVARNPHSYSIAHAIVAMANALSLETIAEGIEEADQAHLLAGIQCHEFQGYLFGKPQSPEAIAILLMQQQGEHS